MMRRSLGRVVFFSFFIGSLGIYLPGVAPNEYMPGSRVELKVNKLTSVKTQLPYPYYSLAFCKPPVIEKTAENLGEVLEGDRIENSPYEILMAKNTTCQVLCKLTLSEAEKKKYKTMIKDDYLVNWLVDNMPAATRYELHRGTQEGETLTRTALYVNGFPVGLLKGDKYFVNNHVAIHLKYHANPELYDGYRIVGFEVEPFSRLQATTEDKSAPAGFTANCEETENAYDLDGSSELIYTYDVRWSYSEIRWASRWDHYLRMSGGQIRWFSILNSFMIVLFLSGMVAMILFRTLHRDIARYNNLSEEGGIEETGWKLCHGDVFRKPRHSKLLVISVGSGVQILLMSFVTLALAMAGILSPVYRGVIIQSMMFLYTFMGIFNGYITATLYKVFNGADWKQTTLLTAFLYPGIYFLVFFILDMILWGKASSGAVPFTTMLGMLCLWFGISVPLTFLGAYYGFRHATVELPVRTNQIPREIPTQAWYLKGWFTICVGGVLPFGAVFTELCFIMSSIWQHQFYYLFGFLGLVVLMLCATCAEISIALTYFILTHENYHWWWRSFLCSASCGVYVFIYSVSYFFNSMEIERVASACLFFGYMFLIALSFSLVTGAVGCLSTFAFVRTIYSAVKID